MLEEIEELELDMDDEEIHDEEKSSSRIRSIISGVVKIELASRLENQKELFPMTYKKSLHYVNYYIVKMKFHNAPKEIKKSILDNAKSIHKKEMHRIRKAFATIRSNIETETAGMEISAELHERIYKYIVYQWLKEEFYIKKTLIRRYIRGFVVFFPEVKAPSVAKSENEEVSKKTKKKKPSKKPVKKKATSSSSGEQKTIFNGFKRWLKDNGVIS